MATETTDEVADIRRQMAQIRQRLHQDMQGVVAGADAASDWKHYVRIYPWAALGLALATGFLIVPRKRRSATKVAEETVARVAEESHAVLEKVQEKPKKGLIAGLFGLVMPLALRAGQSYALGFVENWIAQQQAAATGPAPAGSPPSGQAPGARGPVRPPR